MIKFFVPIKCWRNLYIETVMSIYMLITTFRVRILFQEQFARTLPGLRYFQVSQMHNNIEAIKTLTK